ncbi:CoA-binding protein [Actinophytocola sp. NPDC049390]|uniref:CoA-binding protein n=1 Tax=Actinophytocola sp. NPDC049390 TaxID=3363894 RepID=UPI0037B5FC8F
MRKIADAAAEFLACKRIAVTGVSRNPSGHGANVVHKRLKDRGYEVFAVNPNATEIDGDPCYPDISSIPDGVEAVVVATRAELAEHAVKECVALGIQHVWLHRSFGPGSVSPAATEYGRTHNITVIDGGCPLMYPPASDPAHHVMRWVCGISGTRPKQV